MKEATGEFSMTVITILAVVLIAGIITILGPRIGDFIDEKWNDIADTSVDPGMNDNVQPQQPQ